MRISRAATFYVYNIILPMVIVTTISTFVYLLPCDCGEKISYTITILLTYFVLLLMVSELMPRAGIQVPYISQYQLHIRSTVVCMLYCVEFAFDDLFCFIQSPCLFISVVRKL